MNFPQWISLVVAKKGVADLDNRALSEALEKLWRRHCRLASAPDRLIRVYSNLISPLLGPRCRFTVMLSLWN